MSGAPAGPLVVRPRRLLVVCRVAAAALAVVFTVVGVGLRSGGGAEVFGLADQVAMVLLGLLLAGAVLSLTRVRVVADRTGLRIRNVAGERSLPWQVVRAVRLDDGSPWASLDLHDDDTVALMAVQANDKEHAVRAVVDLRALLRASRDAPPASP